MRTNSKRFLKIFIQLNLIKYGCIYNPADFNKLKKSYLLYNTKKRYELEAIFSLFYHLHPGESFEEYFRKTYESNLRKKMPFFNMFSNLGEIAEEYNKKQKEEAERIGERIERE